MSTIYSKKFLFIGCIAAVCASVVIFLLNKNIQIAAQAPAQSETLTNHFNVEKEASNAQKNENLLPSAAVKLGLEKRLSVTTPEWPTVAGSPQDAAEVNNWFGVRGYDFGQGNNNEYASYDIDTLEKLAQAGDIRAMKYWGKAVYGTVGGLEKAKASYINAAIHGSTDAIYSVGAAIETSVFDNATTPEEKKAAALEALAWFNSAALRGDRWPNIVRAKSFIALNNIELSDQDQQKIQARSQEIYDDLVQKRKTLGLGEFDNSVPDSVNRYLDFLDGK